MTPWLARMLRFLLLLALVAHVAMLLAKGDKAPETWRVSASIRMATGLLIAAKLWANDRPVDSLGSFFLPSYDRLIVAFTLTYRLADASINFLLLLVGFQWDDNAILLLVPPLALATAYGYGVLWQAEAVAELLLAFVETLKPALGRNWYSIPYIAVGYCYALLEYDFCSATWAIVRTVLLIYKIVVDADIVSAVLVSVMFAGVRITATKVFRLCRLRRMMQQDTGKAH